MLFGRTHDVLTSYTMPYTKKKKIRQINRDIDSPSPIYKKFKKMTGLRGKAYEIPGLTYYNHRQNGGHDMTDAIYYTSKYGQEGFNVWLNHIAGDMLRDYWVKNYGSYFANIAEATFLEFSRPKYRKINKNY